MSASIFWERVDPKPKSIGTYAPSSFMEAMARAGMSLPVELDHNSIPVLAGMAAMFGWEKDVPNPYAELVTIINKNGKIRVWPEH